MCYIILAVMGLGWNSFAVVATDCMCAKRGILMVPWDWDRDSLAVRLNERLISVCAKCGILAVRAGIGTR